MMTRVFRSEGRVDRAALRIVCAVIIGLVSSPAGAQIIIADPAPAIPFSRFPATKENYPLAPLNLRTGEDFSFRTRLREAYAMPPNFAGHFVVATWGCGTDCEMGAAIDKSNGRVVWLPGSVCCASFDFNYDVDRFGFRVDSTLLILRGRLDEREGTDAEHYYRMVGDRLEHLRDFKLPPALPDPPDEQ